MFDAYRGCLTSCGNSKLLLNFFVLECAYWVRVRVRVSHASVLWDSFGHHCSPSNSEAETEKYSSIQTHTVTSAALEDTAGSLLGVLRESRAV